MTYMFLGSGPDREQSTVDSPIPQCGMGGFSVRLFLFLFFFLGGGKGGIIETAYDPPPKQHMIILPNPHQPFVTAPPPTYCNGNVWNVVIVNVVL